MKPHTFLLSKDGCEEIDIDKGVYPWITRATEQESQSFLERIRNDERLSPGMRSRPTVDAMNRTYHPVTVDLEHPSMSPELRDRLAETIRTVRI